MGKRELVALLCLSSSCLVIVVWLFLTMPRVCLQFVIVVFPDHPHLLFLWVFLIIPNVYIVKKFVSLSADDTMIILSEHDCIEVQEDLFYLLLLRLLDLVGHLECGMFARAFLNP